ncbi:hypothetical protein [Burkholderia sp. Tr-20390]|uniref:hypothetical protein n=1 Tax=Burkholderia sp. Tr-20390 TaxID=2703904 RepID=UPI00198124AF|nr:hypothetical protein [Burkholderia sp. Tr-20390]MBN3730814.1 hypothetical protein [Burkholderia sp. Tr-20390]
MPAKFAGIALCAWMQRHGDTSPDIERRQRSAGLLTPSFIAMASRSFFAHRCAPSENLLEIPGPNFYIIENHVCITVLTTQTLHVPEIPNNNT